jgi:YfiH family protein
VASSVLFTTRAGGVSEGPYASLNLGLLTDDDPARVEENRRRACAQAGADPHSVAMNRQVHGAVVNQAAAGQRGAPGDGLWTGELGLPLLALGADCLPIVLERINGRPAIAVLHVGRTGLLEGILEAGVAALGHGALRATIGPAIGVCCYEVGEEVSEPYRARFGGGVLEKTHLNLRAAAERVLHDAGAGLIEHVDLCTACHPDLFFSNRRDGPQTGRQGVLAYLA